MFIMSKGQAFTCCADKTIMASLVNVPIDQFFQCIQIWPVFERRDQKLLSLLT